MTDAAWDKIGMLYEWLPQASRSTVYVMLKQAWDEGYDAAKADAEGCWRYDGIDWHDEDKLANPYRGDNK